MKRPLVALAILALSACAVAAPPSWLEGVADRFPGSFLGLRIWQWVGLAILFGLGVVVSMIARYAVRRAIRLQERFAGAGPHSGSRSIRRGVSILGFVLPWYLLLATLELQAEAGFRLQVAIEALTIVGIVLVVYGIWDAICDAIIHRASGVANAEKLLIPVTRKLVRFVIVVAGVLVALGVFGVNITGLLAGVGIGGLVVALAAKDSVENVFGSLTILFDMPFALGDWVKIDKFEGIVEEINLRSTRIRTFEDSVITLPNSNLIKAAVENYGARRYRRQRFFVRVSYANRAESLDHFTTLVREYLDTVKETIPDRTIVEANDMTEASIGVLVQCFFEAPTFKEEARLRNDLLLAILQAGEQAGVIFINTPIPPPEPRQQELTEAERKQMVDRDDII